MRVPRPTHSGARALPLNLAHLLIASAALIIIGCADTDSRPPRLGDLKGSPRVLVTSDFIAPPGPMARRPTITPSPEPGAGADTRETTSTASIAPDPRPVQPAQSSSTTTAGGRPRVVEIGASAPAASEAVSRASPITDATIVIESKVGQINGRPVLASEILEPLDGRLRALAIQQKDPAVWRRDATRIVSQQLISRIRDELVLAEAQANLTVDQRQGLLFFLGKLQENLVSSQGGSSVQADEALQESTGRTLQQEAQDRLDRELIENELRTKVSPRVNVSWRQVQQEYDRLGTKYQPNPVAKLTMIWVDAKDDQAVARITNAASTGTFAQAAASTDNSFRRADGGVVNVEVKGQIAETDFFALPELNNAARVLTPGQTSPAIPFRERIAFIRFDSLEQPTITPLYDAQTEIESSLREKRFSAETQRYFSRLFDRGSFSDIERMAALLVVIAEQRYGPAPAPGTSSTSPRPSAPPIP